MVRCHFQVLIQHTLLLSIIWACSLLRRLKPWLYFCLLSSQLLCQLNPLGKFANLIGHKHIYCFLNILWMCLWTFTIIKIHYYLLFSNNEISPDILNLKVKTKEKPFIDQKSMQYIGTYNWLYSPDIRSDSVILECPRLRFVYGFSIYFQPGAKLL